MKFTNPNGDVFEGSVDEIFTLVSRMRPALPDLSQPAKVIRSRRAKITPNSSGKYPCPNCGKAYSKSALFYHLHTAVVKCTPKNGNGSSERERIIQKVALTDKINGGL